MNPRLLKYPAERLRILSDMSRDFGAEPIISSQPAGHCRQTLDGIVVRSNVTIYGGHPINGKNQFCVMRKLAGVTTPVAIEKEANFIDLASHAGWTDGEFHDLSPVAPQGEKEVGSLFYQAPKGIVPGPQGASTPHDDR